MKRLIIVRHGKSDWNDESIADIDRPLKSRGIFDSYNMAAFLKNSDIIPDLIISSPAVRAISTALIFARVINFNLSKLIINPVIYLNNEDQIIDEIKFISDDVKKLMIVGHNPSFTNLVNLFISNKIDNIPTAGIVIIDFKTHKWEEISKNNVIFETFQFPQKE